MHPLRAPELMRQQNRAVILATIQEHGPISRIELAQILNLNPATVTRITRTLIEENLITEVGEGTSQSAGRKPVLLEFNNRAQLLAGVVVRASEMTGIVADLAGTVLVRRTQLKPPQLESAPLLALFEDLFDTDPSYAPRVTAACVGLPDADHTALTESISTIPLFKADMATLTALGEVEWGMAQGYRHFALLDLGAYSKLCTYLDGQTQVGDLGLSSDGESLSERVNDAGLVRHMEQVLAAGESSALCHQRLSSAMIFEAARQHDPAALRVVRSAADDIAWAAAAISTMLTLDTVFLGGSWHYALDLLIPLIQDKLDTFQIKGPALIPTGLGDDAPLLGTIKLMLQQISLR
jgi:predicted NBD/HSP70 family sugar kinase